MDFSKEMRGCKTIISARCEGDREERALVKEADYAVLEFFRERVKGGNHFGLTVVEDY